MSDKNINPEKGDEKKNNQSKCIQIPDDFEGYDISQFCVVQHYSDVLENILIPNGIIKDRIEKLALDISTDSEFCGNGGISALCVLKGGFKFFADLTEAIENNNRNKMHSVPLSIEFIKVKSYENDESSGKVKISGMDNLGVLAGRSVLVVEDIIDTGRTMKRLLDHLKQFDPACIKVASLLLKRTPCSSGFVPDYVGFEVPNKFLVGYALDYNDYFRDLGHICVINDEGKQRFRQ